MRRREFIAGLSGAAVMPLAAFDARAQQKQDKVRRVAVLFPYPADDSLSQSRYAAFLQGLQQTGWTIGHNLRIDVRWAVNAAEIRKFSAELIGLAPDVIVANGGSVVLPMMQMTRTVPIVFPLLTDPVGAGVVDSLARPGGNVTGFMNFEFGMGGKWLELLKQIAPKITRAGILRDPTQGSGTNQFAAIQAVAPSLSIETVPLNMRDAADIEGVFTAFARQPNGGVIVTAGAVSNRSRDLIIGLAARYKLPAVYSERFFVTAGGLVSYGPDQIDQYRLAAGYVDRILQGEKPGDLPVQAPTKLETVVNLKTAKALGLEVPQSLLARADEVIE